MAIVYRHIRKDTNQVFYVGVGVSQRRAYKVGRNPYWNNVVDKTDYEVQIMFDDISYEQALEKEMEFIALYGRADLGLGPLTNLTDGGKGTIGRESWCKGGTNPGLSKALKDKPKTEDHKAKIGLGNKGTIRLDLRGVSKSEETKAKMSAANRKPKQKVECEYCNRMISTSNIARHSIKCKLK